MYNKYNAKYTYYLFLILFVKLNKTVYNSSTSKNKYITSKSITII